MNDYTPEERAIRAQALRDAAETFYHAWDVLGRPKDRDWAVIVSHRLNAMADTEEKADG